MGRAPVCPEDGSEPFWQVFSEWFSHQNRGTGSATRNRKIRELERIMEDDTGGDPVKGCKWTHKTTAKVAEALNPAGIHVSANTVARLLKQMDYALRVNLKSLESGLSKPPDPVERDAQFRHIMKQGENRDTHFVRKLWRCNGSVVVLARHFGSLACDCEVD